MRPPPAGDHVRDRRPARQERADDVEVDDGAERVAGSTCCAGVSIGPVPPAALMRMSSPANRSTAPEMSASTAATSVTSAAMASRPRDPGKPSWSAPDLPRRAHPCCAPRRRVRSVARADRSRADRAADATRPAGHDGDLAVEIERALAGRRRVLVRWLKPRLLAPVMLSLCETIVHRMDCEHNTCRAAPATALAARRAGEQRTRTTARSGKRRRDDRRPEGAREDAAGARPVHGRTPVLVGDRDRARARDADRDRAPARARARGSLVPGQGRLALPARVRGDRPRPARDSVGATCDCCSAACCASSPGRRRRRRC